MLTAKLLNKAVLNTTLTPIPISPKIFSTKQKKLNEINKIFTARVYLRRNSSLNQVHRRECGLFY